MEFSLIKGTNDFCFSTIMASNAWGDWSDDDFLAEIDEWSEDNDSTPVIGDGRSNNQDDETIRNINEDEILRTVNDEHTGRGEKRQNVNLSDSEDEPSKKRKNQNVVSSDTEDNEPIPSDEFIPGTSEENEQTGQGKKRKAENQDVEQEQDYYRIKPVRDYHSQKFNIMAKNYSVQFNNVLHDVNLLESQNRTYDIFDHLIRDVTQGMHSTDQV